MEMQGFEDLSVFFVRHRRLSCRDRLKLASFPVGSNNEEHFPEELRSRFSYLVPYVAISVVKEIDSATIQLLL